MAKMESLSVVTRSRLWVFFSGLVLLTLLFVVPLSQWVRLALSVDLHSHVILIPFVTAYMIWLQREELPVADKSAWPVATLFAVAAVGLVCLGLRWKGEMEAQDRIALLIGAYVLAGSGLGFACFGIKVMRAIVYPLLLLLFMVPVPSGLENMLEHLLQRFSADAAQAFFWIFGETFLRDGQAFHFPGLTIRVAQECSGIRSSLVLFILSLVAARLMLRSWWHRAVLVLAVVPLGILRNGLRVYAITALTLHIDPNVIDSAFHHRGGPIFFVISLVPFTALLWFLWKREQSSIQHTNKSPV